MSATESSENEEDDDANAGNKRKGHPTTHSSDCFMPTQPQGPHTLTSGSMDTDTSGHFEGIDMLDMFPDMTDELSLDIEFPYTMDELPLGADLTSAT